MTIEFYERNFEQKLGLNDIKVEGYEEDADKNNRSKL